MSAATVTWISCICDDCGATLGATRTRFGGFELFAAHLPVCTGTTR